MPRKAHLHAKTAYEGGFLIDKNTIKKLLTRKRNKRDWLIARQLQHNQYEAERTQQLAEQQKPAESPPAEEKPWMAKTHEARNRLTDKKRGSAERWNRFAGTSESGGRGL